MGRTRDLASSLAALRKKISFYEIQKKRIIDYSQRILKDYKEQEISASEYFRLVEEKFDGKTLDEWLDYYDYEIERCNQLINKQEHNQLTKKIYTGIFIVFVVALLLTSLIYYSPKLQGFSILDKETSQEDSSPSQEESLFSRLISKFQKVKTTITGFTVEDSGDSEQDTSSSESSSESSSSDSSDSKQDKAETKEDKKEDKEDKKEDKAEAKQEKSNSQEQEEVSQDEESSPSQEGPSPASEITEEQVIEEEIEEQTTQDSQTSQDSISSTTEEVSQDEDLSPSQEASSGDETITNQTSTQQETSQINESNSQEQEEVSQDEDSSPSQEEPSPASENITQEITNITEENTTQPPENESEQVLEEIQNNTETNITEDIVNLTETPETNISTVNITTRKYKAVIGKPVKWIKQIKIENTDNLPDIKIELPKEATNITIKTGISASDEEIEKEMQEYEDLLEKADKEDIKTNKITGYVAYDIENSQGIITRFWKWLVSFFTKPLLTGHAILDETQIQDTITETLDSKNINITNLVEQTQETEIAIEFYTESPQAIEQELANGKRVTISAPHELGYEDILAYTELEKQVSESDIQLYHIVDGERQVTDFEAHDLDENGLIDYVEWIVPHLSEQIYEIVLGINTCAASGNDPQGSFPDACDYPDGSALESNGGTTETHAFGKDAKWGGVLVTFENTSVTECSGIEYVEICYEWWATAGTTCDISVDANNGASWSAASTACPGTTPNPGLTCTDVTDLETWTCGNFFGPTGTRAQAKSEIISGSNGQLATWDALYFNVNYSSDILPEVALISPANNSGSASGNIDFICNATDNLALANSTFYWNYQGIWQANETQSIAGTFNETTFSFTNLNDSIITWNCLVCDAAGNCDFAPANYTYTINTTDITPPNAVTNLVNISNGPTYILWNWTNPSDPDFYENIIYLDEINVKNTSNHSYTGSGFLPNSTHTIRINTIDQAGNINYTNITNSSTTTIPRESIFFDDFEVLTLLDNNWTNQGGGTAWTRETINPYDGSYHLYTENTNGESIIQRDISTNSYSNIYFDFYAYTSGLDAGEYFAVDWYNGTGWTEVLNVQTIATYTFYNFSLDSSANNNPDFAIRFRCSSNNNNEECYVDSVDIHGTLADFSPPNSITNLNNISSGTSWIYWNWTNPIDSDFFQNIIYINGTNIVNTSNNFYNATGLSHNTSYTITVYTIDIGGLINNTDINNTASTLLEDFAPSVNLALPYNNSVDTDGNLTFICNATEDFNLENITFYWNYQGIWQANETQSATGLYSQKVFQKDNLNDSTIIWNCLACDNKSQCSFAPNNYTANIILGWLTPTSVISFSGEESNGLAAETIDYDLGTYWRDAASQTHSIVYDLGDTYAINAIRTYDDTGSASMCNLNVSVSADSNFDASEIVSSNNSQDKVVTGWIPIYFNSSQGRYIKLTFDMTTGGTCGVASLPGSTFNEFQFNASTAQYAPNITYVSSIPNINPIEASSTQVNFDVQVYDENGVEDINDNSIIANFTRQGQTTRTNTCTHQNDIDAYRANYSCSIDMWYFDEAGNWNVTVYVEDSSGLNATNSSTYFQYNLLQAIVISPNTLIFDASTGATNTTASNHPTIVNNTGNYNATGKVAINALDLYSGTNIFAVANFTIGISSGEGSCSEDQLINGTDITLTDTILEAGNLSAGVAQEELYYCIPEVPSLVTGTYDTTQSGSWTIKLILSLTALVISKKKKKKSKIKREGLVISLNIIAQELEQEYSEEKRQIIKLLLKEIKRKYHLNNKEVTELIEIKREIQIPSKIFVEELGALESITKYMKENLDMSYHEIAEELERDDRTIWTAYNKSKKKYKKTFIIDKKDKKVPLTVFRNRKLTILESLIIYLKEQGLKYSEISKEIKRDQRNIWTIYKKAIKK